MNQLRQEIEKGNRAIHAYEMYVKEFIERVEADLYQQFLSVSTQEENTILEIKRLSTALAALKHAILQDIETGKLAEKQLSDEIKH